MSELLMEARENLRFVTVSILIVIALVLLSKLAEHFFPEKRKVSIARRVSIIGICSAIATVLHIFDFPVLFIAPGFYKLDFSELPVLLCGFFLGPSAAVVTEGIKILLKLVIKSTSTAFVGDLANFVVGCSFVLPAVIWYHVHKSRHNAVIGLIIGTLSMTVLGSAFNAVYLIPTFAQMFIPGPMSAAEKLQSILSMGTQIHPGIDSLTTFVMLCVAPLNLLKGTVVSVLTLLLYKKVARPLFGLHR